MPGRRKRTEPLAKQSEPMKGEYIGFIKVPIPDSELEQTIAILKRHAVKMEKIPTPDSWYTLFLPDGTTKIKKETQGMAPIYTVHLPDGYSFLYRTPVFNYNKSYDTLPMITILSEE